MQREGLHHKVERWWSRGLAGVWDYQHGSVDSATQEAAAMHYRHNATPERANPLPIHSTFSTIPEVPLQQGSGRCGPAILPASGGELEVFYCTH